MTPTSSRREKVRLIRRINEIIEMYQQRVLSTDDFDMLIDLDVDELYNVEAELIRQSRDMEELTKH